MGMAPQLHYKKGDIFGALNKKDIFVHACNAQGVWGAGIAKKFKQRFPLAFKEHTEIVNFPGHGYVVQHESYKIGCLITSEYYGKYADSPKDIADNTYRAVGNMLMDIKFLVQTGESKPGITIHSPKINTGLFKTPWHKTEKSILTALAEFSLPNPDIIKAWIIWELK